MPTSPQVAAGRWAFGPGDRYPVRRSLGTVMQVVLQTPDCAVTAGGVPAEPYHHEDDGEPHHSADTGDEHERHVSGVGRDVARLERGDESRDVDRWSSALARVTTIVQMDCA